MKLIKCESRNHKLNSVIEKIQILFYKLLYDSFRKLFEWKYHCSIQKEVTVLTALIEG